MERPIVVCCVGRSGSSMVTGVLALHGAWTGDCVGPNARRDPRGYWENRAIKKAGERALPPRPDGRELPPIPGWGDTVRAILRREGYVDGPWVVKHFAPFWRSWDTLAPTWILPRRDPEDVFRSTQRAGFWRWLSDDQLREAIGAQVAVLDYLRDARGGIEVDADAVTRGDRTSLARAVEGAGLNYDDEVAETFIDPRFWGRKGR